MGMGNEEPLDANDYEGPLICRLKIKGMGTGFKTNPGRQKMMANKNLGRDPDSIDLHPRQ